MAGNRHLIEIIHAGPAEMPVGDRKTRRLDNMGLDIQACAKPQNRARILRDVGLEKCDLHSVMVPGGRHEMVE